VQVLPARGEGDAAVGEFPVVTTSCSGASLPPGQTCAVAVAFRPATAGGRSATLGIGPAGPGAGGALSVALAGVGTGGPATLSASPPTVDFGTVAAGTRSAARTVTLFNASGTALQLRSVRLGGADAAAFALSPATCKAGASLPRDGQCTVGLVFQPPAAGGRSATVVVDHTASGSPLTVALTGAGAVASAGADPTRVSFGSRPVGASTELRTVTVSNKGEAPLRVGTVALAGANSGDFVFSADRCSGATVDPGRTCTVGVGFAPQHEGGRSATLTIPHGAAGSPLTVALSGTGAVTADLSVTLAPSSSMATVVPWTVTVRNAGPSDATALRLVVSGTDVSLSPGEPGPWQCTVADQFPSQIVCTLRALAPNARAALEVDVGLFGEGAPSITAEVKSAEPDPYGGDNKASASIPAPMPSDTTGPVS
jgi:hypothetical protein